MLPGLAKRFRAAEAATARFVAELRGASGEQRRFRPAPSAWGMIEVTEHLVLAEERSLLGVLKGPRAGTRVTLAAHGRMSLVRMVLATGIRVQVPVAAVIPRGSHDLEGLELRWADARRGLSAAFEGLDALHAAGPVFRHPLTGWVSAGEGLDFITTHINHHARQLRRIQSAAGYPPS